MKKVIASMFLILLLAVSPMVAETATNSITLSGSVLKQFSVTPSALTYSFANVGATDALLADLKIVSNYTAGFSITFTSTKGSFVINNGLVGGTNWVYTLTLTDPTDASVKVVSYNTPIPFTGRKHPGVGANYPLKITYPADTGLDFGSYTGNIEITITSL